MLRFLADENFKGDRTAAGAAMPGLFVVPRRMAIRQAIDELLLVVACTDANEWASRVLYLPL